MLLSINSYSQWSNTTSSNIYKTNNKGNTGIGTSSPVTKLDIVEENGKEGKPFGQVRGIVKHLFILRCSDNLLSQRCCAVFVFQKIQVNIKHIDIV